LKRTVEHFAFNGFLPGVTVTYLVLWLWTCIAI
jgi:hypothetical protein